MTYLVSIASGGFAYIFNTLYNLLINKIKLIFIILKFNGSC